VLSSFLVALTTISSAYGQINVYENLIDPTAICRIDDVNPLRYEIRQGIKQERDSEGFMTVFEHIGPGIITHIWTTVDKDDSLSKNTIWNLYIDGELILRAPIVEFFSGRNGLLRPPLDTLFPMAFVCNVQIPFRKSVRLSSNPIGNPASSYYAVAWKSVDINLLSSSFSLHGDSLLSKLQESAEAVFRQGKPDWSKEQPQLIGVVKEIPPGSEMSMFDTSASAILSLVQLRMLEELPVALDSLRLRIYWDNSPYASVDVPVSDFFMNGIKNSTVTSFYVHSATGHGLSSHFPMPFQHRARITITNYTSTSLSILGFFGLVSKVIDTDTFGYFHAYFNESKPTPFGVLHPVLHEKGRGRFIGIAHTIPSVLHPSVIEGDPIISIDSTPEHFIRYTGGEDYYNGGWWFFFQEYSTPFAGHYNRFKSYYRLHILDPLDFTSSIDFDFQHGVRSDVEEHVRTVAYYYKQWSRFWCDRDTIRYGEQWRIGGAGYQKNESLVISLAGVVLKQVIANEQGSFDVTITLPSNVPIGATKLSVNGEELPESICIIPKAIITPISDYYPIILRFGDSILINGKGFIPGEKVRMYFDNFILAHPDTITVGEDYGFSVLIRIPQIADRKYRLSVRGGLSGEIISSEPISVSRDIDIEFEKLTSGASWYRGWVYRENLTYRWYENWSKQAIARFEADSVGDTCSFSFYLSVSDTFDVRYLGSVGSQFGDFIFSIDGKQMGIIKGYRKPDVFWINVFPSDTMNLGIIPLDEGVHTFSIRCIGKDSNAVSYFCGPDVLQLRPTTVMPLTPGTIIDTVASSVQDIEDDYRINIYPNPATDDVTFKVVTERKVNNLRWTYTIIDSYGRIVASEPGGESDTLGPAHTFSISHLTSGSYTVIFTCFQGKETRKFSRHLTVTK
jgi:hypothetical protein